MSPADHPRPVRRVAGRRGRPGIDRAADQPRNRTDEAEETRRPSPGPLPYTRPKATEPAAADDAVETDSRSGTVGVDEPDDATEAIESAPDGAESEPPPARSSASGTQRSFGPPWLLPVGSAVLIVVFAAAAIFLGLRLYSDHQRSNNRATVLRLVPSYGAKILSFDYRKLDQNAAAARPLLIGKYQSDYNDSMQRNAAQYRKYHYVVKSTVTSAGVVSAGTHTVTVVAFVDQTVTAGAKKSSTGSQAIRLNLTFEHEHGKWLLSDVQPL